MGMKNSSLMRWLLMLALCCFTKAVPLELQKGSQLADAALEAGAPSVSRAPKPAGPPPLAPILPFPPIMPEPKEWTNGTQTLPLCSVFRIVPPSPSSPDLEDMIARYRTLITPRKPSTGRGLDNISVRQSFLMAVAYMLLGF